MDKINTLSTYLQSLINEVHSIWESNQQIYYDGYAIFYSYVNENPDLMIIGDNPGGDANSFSGKEILFDEGQPMEYITYRNDKYYKIAGKTCDIFDSIGYLEVLRKSVKTNRYFFRSKTLGELANDHKEFCLEKVSQIVYMLNPKIILCESIGSYESVLSILNKDDKNNNSNKYNETSICKSDGYRIFIVSTCANEKKQAIVGYHHLTATNRHLTTDEISIIKLMLKNELDKLLK